MDFSFFSIEYINMAVSAFVIYLVALDFFKGDRREHCGIIYMPTKEMKYWEWLRAVVLVVFIIVENNFIPMSEQMFNYVGMAVSTISFFFFQYYYKHLADMLRKMYRKDSKKLARIIDKPQVVFYGYLLFSLFMLKHAWYLFR